MTQKSSITTQKIERYLRQIQISKSFIKVQPTHKLTNHIFQAYPLSRRSVLDEQLFEL